MPHGYVKNRNPSRKHICAGDIIEDILFYILCVGVIMQRNIKCDILFYCELIFVWMVVLGFDEVFS